jgi:hypothetical protein
MVKAAARLAKNESETSDWRGNMVEDEGGCFLVRQQPAGRKRP